MHVGAEPRVIGDVPARMVWVVIDYDRVGTPQPVADVSVFPRGNAPIPSVEPEAAWPTTSETPLMTRAETASKPAMLIRMIDMKAAVVRSRVPHPAIISCVHVWRVRVAWRLTEILLASMIRFACMGRLLIVGILLHLGSCRPVLLPAAVFRTMRRDVSAAYLGMPAPLTAAMVFLGRNDDRKAQQTS